MNKTISFQLSKFANIPNKLTNTSTGNINPEFIIDLARLYHHYYTDSYGIAPPNPDYSNFEYLRFLSSTFDFRFLNDGPGVSVGKRRCISTDLGQAFCRYFLYEFCEITYFAHMDKILDKPIHPAFGGITVKRIAEGDAPDYICASSPSQPYVGEAKGRFDNITFSSKQFDNWRKQFERIAVLDPNGNNKKLKGYIVATKFSTEENRPSNKSKLLAEDPETIGEDYLGDNFPGLGRGVIAVHYSRLLSKLGLNLLASSLEQGFTVPDLLTYTLPAWRCLYGPLNGVIFIGGFISDSEPRMVETSNGSAIFYPNILKIGGNTPFFFGITADVIRTIRQVSLGNWELLAQVPQLEDTEFRSSNLAWLRDGSISGSLEFFEFIGTIQI